MIDWVMKNKEWVFSGWEERKWGQATVYVNNHSALAF